MYKSVIDSKKADANSFNNNYNGVSEVKTTNINILLNRVRLNKKEILKKKIIFLTILAFIICCVAFLSIF